MDSSTNATTSPNKRPEAAADPLAGGTEDGGPQLLSFDLGGGRFGCPLADIREIIPSRRTTRLPGAPAHVLGLLNLRGSLLTVLDLELALLEHRSPPAAAPGEEIPAGAAGRPARARGQVLVVEVDGRRVGCRVDAVRRVHPMPALLAPPEVGNEMPPGIVLGIGDAGDTMVAVLDLPALARDTLLFPGER